MAQDGHLILKPSIAVIVPNWNDARYLPRCLRSVLNQEAGPEELIVIDDKSTDDSVDVIRSLIAGNPRAELVVNPVNLGTNGALNEGLRRTRCDYVLFLAANDFVLPGIFARAKSCITRAPGVGLWSAMAWRVDEEDRTVRLHPSAVVALDDAAFSPEQCVKLAYRFGNWFTGTTLIYRRDALEAVGGFDPAYGAPSDLITALVVASLHGAAYSPDPLAAIRIHSGSFSAATLTDLAKLDAILEQITQRGPWMSPLLFSAAFLERTALRNRFASVRESRGALLPEVAARLTSRRRSVLFIVNRLVPHGWWRLRVALAFLILRPFDIAPALVHRLFGWAIVRLRVYMRGEGPP